jgi:hypothetical protein
VVKGRNRIQDYRKCTYKVTRKAFRSSHPGLLSFGHNIITVIRVCYYVVYVKNYYLYIVYVALSVI